MDQRETESSRLLGPQSPSDYLADLLGSVLREPVRDIPTVEDWQREQGMAGVPTEEDTEREVGRKVLDYLNMAYGISSLFRGGSSAAQELMGTRRGAETFGKEMMETSRRAQSKRWHEEQVQAPLYERPGREGGPYRVQDLGPRPRESLAPEVEVQRGRAGYEAGDMPQTGSFRLPQDAPRPRDVVREDLIVYKDPRRGGTSQEVNGYVIGDRVPLPGGQSAQYVVIPSPEGAYVGLTHGDRLYRQQFAPSIGEALAMARQLQNRLALAAKDPDLAYAARQTKLTGADRQIRMPWERGGITDWRSDYYPPPTSGRWSGEQ